VDVTVTPRGARYWITLVIIGLIGGLLSGAFGVGGGIIMVPLLISFVQMDQRRAGATSRGDHPHRTGGFHHLFRQ